MALTSQSTFLFGYEVNEFNSSIDFQAATGGPILTATLNFGAYSSDQLLAETKTALEAADPINNYTLTIDRTINSGTENRITFSTNGTFFELLWLSGPRNATSAHALYGFPQADYSGATAYTGNTTSGILLTPDYVAYNYLGPEFMRTVFGTVSITAGGIKEAIVWQVQQFFQAEFKFEPQTKVIAEWQPFLEWAIQQKPFEFTPQITAPTTYYGCTLETTGADGKGLGYVMSEQLPDFPFKYKTGMMKFRRILS